MKAITIRDTLRKLIRPRRTRQAPRSRSFLPRLEVLEDHSVPSAVVTSVSPAFGPTSGGTGVAIRGSGFTGASAVAFGASSALNYFVSSDTLVMASSPSEAAGTVDVTVTTPSGTSPTSSADQFTYGTATTTSLSSSANPTTYGQSVTLTATVTASGGTPTGTVWFNDGGNVIGTVTLNGFGTATFTTSALTTGSHSITAVYGGDANYFGSTSSALTQTVQVASTTTTLTSSAPTANVGQAVTFTARVAGTSGGAPTGTVTFMDGSKVLGTGTLNPGGNGSQATFTTSSLLAGVHSITAVYGGDANFAGSSSSALTQTVAVNGAYVWTGALSSDWNTVANWLVNGVTATTAPSASSDVIFGGPQGTSNNCSAGTAETVHSVTIDSNYGGTISLFSTLTVTALDMEGGAINQVNGAGTSDITVSGAFNWVNGILNSGSNLGNVILTGSATLSGPGFSTGSNLVLDGTTLTFNLTGNLTFKNNAGVTMSNDAYFGWLSATANILTSGPNPTGMFVNNGGTLDYQGGNLKCDLPYVNNDDTALLWIDGSGTLEFDKAGATNGVSVLQNKGDILLGGLGNIGGADLGVDHGLTMNGGTLTTAHDATTYITGGNVIITKGTVFIGAKGTGELDCAGLVTMNGGTYEATVDLSNPKKLDVWQSNTGFLIGGTATLTVAPVNIPAQLPKGQAYPILQTLANNEITGDFATKNVAIGATGKSFTAGPDANKQNYDVTTP